ncbi:AMP-binding protein [Streptomyces thinghirensis]|nr:AMP-binding protein [Streptomyces thinghirensis]
MSVPLHELISRQAVRTPHAIAVDDAQGTMTYEQLDRHANRVARLLRDRGVAPEERVAVSLPRRRDLPAVLLGVWKAGAAYVPLDAAHPAERTAWMVEDSGARLVLAARGTAPEGVDEGVVLLLDAPETGLDAQPDTAPEPPAADPANAAYLAYTSGSTGLPKGVLVEHAGIANRVSWTVTRQGLGADDRMVMKTVLTFDAAALELFAPLVAGGTVVMAPPGAESDPALLVRTIAEQHVTVVQGVPSVLRLLTGEPGWARCGALRLVFRRRGPRRRAVPPPERADRRHGVEHVRAHRVLRRRHRPEIRPGAPHGGRTHRPPPRRNARLRAGRGVRPRTHRRRRRGVRRRYRPRPRLLRAPGTDRGALPARPAQRRRRPHVPHRRPGPLALRRQPRLPGPRRPPGEGQRCPHRTGRGRGRPERPPRCAWGRRRGVPHRRRAPGSWPTWWRAAASPATNCAASFGAGCPESMIPARFMPMDAFPLTANGKVDRSALPDPTAHETAVRGDAPASVAPRTPAERLVADVWEQLLQVENVGVHDDFFALGGSSPRPDPPRRRPHQGVRRRRPAARSVRRVHRGGAGPPHRGVPARRA